ncbi:hypothetical protein OOK31_00320 [Streptomyces sp. NBC_00249]|uniref:hypothetical protein n=1 Tax=Streptomyces sp. NBC_00249 TaxID=2975690 RepID=UPI00225891FA|nr:hypothetical protein [Streptomyces sp. NBC_00249]MCX5192347.1 hypothetical protein [Streptomyces sp. NBC_00249]
MLHRAHGLYGQPPRLDPPKLPLRYLHPDLAWMKGEHMLTGPISALRDHHAKATKKGYAQVLIAPACVRLEVEEHPLPPEEDPRDARPHPGHSQGCHPARRPDGRTPRPPGRTRLQAALTAWLRLTQPPTS